MPVEGGWIMKVLVLLISMLQKGNWASRRAPYYVTTVDGLGRYWDRAQDWVSHTALGHHCVFYLSDPEA